MSTSHFTVLNLIPDTNTDLPGIGSGEWMFPLGDVDLKIKMQYTDTTFKIKDLDVFASGLESSSKPNGAIICFLRQFRDVNVQVANFYEPFTSEMIALTAQVQADILESRIGQKKLSDGNVLIAEALRVLALSFNLSLVLASLPICGQDLSDRFWETEILNQQNPVIEASRWEPSKSGDSWIEKQQPGRFASMIENVVRTTQRLLLRGLPTDWPIIFWTLCLLRIIQSDIGPYPDCVTSLDLGPFKVVFRHLCNLWMSCTMGDPLSLSWNEREYARLVGAEHPSLDWFAEIRATWFDGKAVQFPLASRTNYVYLY